MAFSFLDKKIKFLNFCFPILKHQVSSTPTLPSDDLHRPFPSTTITSFIPIYLRKYTSLHIYPTTTATFESCPSPPLSIKSVSMDVDSSVLSCEYHGDVDMELKSGASTPDFSSIYASQRFFFSPPGRSNSIFDSASPTLLEEEEIEGERSVHLSDQYMNFRRSMEETVEARDLHDVLANWQSFQELLLRYLSQNPSPTHKSIVRAFADLLVTLMSPPSDNSSTSHYHGDTDVDMLTWPSTPNFASIVDSASSISSEDEVAGREMVVQTYSPDPYTDFRRSMEDMVEARELHNVVANWQSLRELLLRYLSLNLEPTHKFIIGAFADLLVSLMSPPS